MTAYVDGKQFVEVVGRDIGDRARLGQAGVVDEHVEAAEMVGGGFYDVCAKLRQDWVKSPCTEAAVPPAARICETAAAAPSSL